MSHGHCPRPRAARHDQLCIDTIRTLAMDAVQLARSGHGWSRYVGEAGEVIGMHAFGASASLKALQTKFGFTPEHVVQAARSMLARARAVAERGDQR